MKIEDGLWETQKIIGSPFQLAKLNYYIETKKHEHFRGKLNFSLFASALTKQPNDNYLKFECFQIDQKLFNMGQTPNHLQYLIKMHKKQKKEKGNMVDRQNKQNNMKKVPQNDSYNLVSSDSNQYQELFNMIHKNKQKEAKSKNQRTSSNIVSIEHQEEEKVEEQALSICLVCLQDSFEGGKCRLICGHIFCGDCTSHWQQITDKCPACNRKISQIVYELGGQERTKKIRFTPFIPNCQKCGKDNEYNQMYFCDDCNKSCIHTYCQPSLMNENKFEQWICENCIYSNYHENKYESQQIEYVEREESYQDDGFVVPDSYQDFRQDFDEVISHESGLSKKGAKANQKKVLKPMGKKKDKGPKSKRR